MAAKLETAESRQVAPTPNVTRLQGDRPSAKTIRIAQAGTDYPISRPLGYKVRMVTITAPDSTYATGGNGDSVYVDIEDINVGTVTPDATASTVELPPGKSYGWEEIDPGWLHVASPTAGQRVFVTYGGRSGNA